MRELERIDRITAKLNELWHRHPDQRFGQLIENYIANPTFFWYQEDDETEMRVDYQLEQMVKVEKG